MKRRSSALDTAGLATFVLTRCVPLWIGTLVCVGCFPTGTSTNGDGGTSVGFSSPTLELTVSGVHFGPMAPDAGAFVDLVTTRDAGGKPTASTFKMSASRSTETAAAACCIPGCARCSASAPSAIRFSVPDSSSISRLNCSFALAVADSSRRPRAAGRGPRSAGSRPGSSPRETSPPAASTASRRCPCRCSLRGREALDGLDQIGNQVVAALQLVLHLAPLRLDRFFLRRELVVRTARHGTASTNTSTID